MTPRKKKVLTPEEEHLCRLHLDRSKSPQEIIAIQAKKLLESNNRSRSFFNCLVESARLFDSSIKSKQVSNKAQSLKKEKKKETRGGNKAEFPELETLLLSIISFPLNPCSIVRLANSLLHSKFSDLIQNDPKRKLTRRWYKGFSKRYDLKNKEQIELKRRENRPKVFCMAMSYPDIPATISTKLTGIKKDPNPKFWKKVREGQQHRYLPNINLFDINHANPSLDEVLALLDRVLPENDSRDMAKVVATETACDCNVYTNSLQKGIIYRDDRHIFANWNSTNYVIEIKRKFGENIKFSCIIFDSYWMPKGYHDTYWPEVFFQHMHKLASILEDPLDEEDEDCFETGVILLPLALHLLFMIEDNIKVLRGYFEISFMDKYELHGNALWKGTQTIPDNIMLQEFKKKKDQEDFYCSFKSGDITKSTPPGYSSKGVKAIVDQIGDDRLKDIRIIRLKKLTGRPGEVPGFNLAKRSTRVVYQEQINQGQLRIKRGFRMKCHCSACEGTKRHKTADDGPGSKVQCLETVDEHGRIRRVERETETAQLFRRQSGR